MIVPPILAGIFLQSETDTVEESCYQNRSLALLKANERKMKNQLRRLYEDDFMAHVSPLQTTLGRLSSEFVHPPPVGRQQ
jgi:hypothetical protein